MFPMSSFIQDYSQYCGPSDPISSYIHDYSQESCAKCYPSVVTSSNKVRRVGHVFHISSYIQDYSH